MLDPHELFRAVVTLNALFASMAWCLARPNRVSMSAVLVFAVLWPFVDRPLTGRLLLVLTEQNGVTEADLISVVAVMIVAFQAAWQVSGTRKKSKPAPAVAGVLNDDTS